MGCLPAGIEVQTRWGNHFLRQEPIVQLWPKADRWIKAWPVVQDSDVDAAAGLDQVRLLHKGKRPSGADHSGSSGNFPRGTALPPDQSTWEPVIRDLVHAFPQRAVFLDLETCGFAGSMVFLIGLIHERDGQLVLSQLLARHYGEEKAILHSLWDVIADMDVLVTFNGKSFDWPMVADRSILHHINRENGELATWTHCDLLHPARRRWKMKLPNCKLQTLERYVCGRSRTQDIGGSEIPAVYHDFVRTGDAWLMRSVLHHNALDLITLVQLAQYLTRPQTVGEKTR